MSIRRAIPLVLLLIGLWLLAGCFYLPLPEHPTEKNQKDFRSAFGDAQSKRPLRTDIATRRQVIALLGEPRYASADNRSIAYVLYTGKGGWIYPLCFQFDAETKRVYAVRLDFDEADVLRGWEMAHGELQTGPFVNLPNIVAQNLVRALSRSEHPLKPRPTPTPATQPDAPRR